MAYLIRINELMLTCKQLSSQLFPNPEVCHLSAIIENEFILFLTTIIQMFITMQTKLILLPQGRVVFYSFSAISSHEEHL